MPDRCSDCSGCVTLNPPISEYRTHWFNGFPMGFPPCFNDRKTSVRTCKRLFCFRSSVWASMFWGHDDTQPLNLTYFHMEPENEVWSMICQTWIWQFHTKFHTSVPFFFPSFVHLFRTPCAAASRNGRSEPLRLPAVSSSSSACRCS